MKRVYFIKPIGMDGPIKIGASKSPGDRCGSLETWCPFPLEVVAELAGTTEIERRFHAMFRLDHRGHEWFNVTDRLLDVIASINAGNFDVSTLPEPRVLRRERCDAIIPRNPEAASIIARLGGVTRVARMIGARIATVQRWKHTGIPTARMAPIRAALAREAA